MALFRQLQLLLLQLQLRLLKPRLLQLLLLQQASRDALYPPSVF